MVRRFLPPETQGVGQQLTVPAPFLGLNTRDSFNIVRLDEARELINFFPESGALVIRPGYREHAMVPQNVPLQGIYSFQTASENQMLASGGGNLYDVSSESAIKISPGTNTYTKNLWSTASYGGRFFGVNGLDTPWVWDGSSLSTPDFVTDSSQPLFLTDLTTVQLVRSRLWFTERDKADVWYGGLGSISGRLSRLQLSQMAAGGHCVAIGSFSTTSGQGPQDHTVFIMNTGEIIMYRGDPAVDFNIAGKWVAPPPITSSFGCTVQVAGELIILTTKGPIPVSAILQGHSFSPDSIGAWGKINPSWEEDVRRFGGNDGWSAHFHNGIAYFNIITNSIQTTKQYVYNTAIPAWTMYQGLPVAKFASSSLDLYFAGHNQRRVYHHSGGTDLGEEIVGTARQGFHYPLDQSVSKHFTMIKPNILADGTVQGQFHVDVDFLSSDFKGGVHDLVTAGTGAHWGDPWGSDWAGPARPTKTWKPLVGWGLATAPVVRLFSKADLCRWESTDLVCIPGGIY